MCGIVGFLTESTIKGEAARQKFLTQGLLIDTLRGNDSTGVFVVGHESLYEDKSPLAWWTKEATDGYSFTQSKEYFENFSYVTDYRAAVGHNRAATVGGYGQAQAHPFQEGPITLVHNGTLSYGGGLKTPMSSLKGVTVDSHAICHNLAKHAAKDVVENLRGAFTLVWHDARDNTVNIVRNDERPLHMGVGQGGKTLFFMSEASMLAMLDTRLNLGIKSIYYPKPGHLLTWHKGTKVDRPEIKELTLEDDNTAFWQNYGGINWNKRDNTSSYYQGSSSSDIEHSNKINIGGDYKEIPMHLQEALLEKDMTVEDRLLFTPVQDTTTRSQTGARVSGFMSVLGVLENGLPARIYRTSANLLGVMKRDWLVRPVAVKGVDGNEDSPLVIVQLITSNPENNKAYRDRKAKENASTPADNVAQTYKGPGGSLVSSYEMERLLSEGCLWCHCNLTMADVHDIVWTKSRSPICWDCSSSPGLHHIEYNERDL